ncbi:hypothetical protein RND81_11G198900 [Saponaria officinalis]|uniref:HMG box domain-containing protein n=1 Tax=Saponaria officinalis TaxID=3572 RepID=A0AAW1HNH1_SAPOF
MRKYTYRSSSGVFGPIVPIGRNCESWEDAKFITNHILLDHLDSPPIAPVRLLKADIQMQVGFMYYLTFRVKAADGVSTTYKAQVLRKPGAFHVQTYLFEKVPGSQRRERHKKSSTTGGPMKSDEAGNSKKGYKQPAPHKGRKPISKTSSTSAGSVVNIEGSSILLSGEFSRKLHFHAFYLLVAQIRSKTPSLPYARARKAASYKWKSLSKDDKMAFLDEASKRLSE